MTKRRTVTKCTRNELYSYLVSKMKHIQKDYKGQDVHSSGMSQSERLQLLPRNDEHHAVPSVKKLTDKLSDEEVDETILETDVDDTQCSEQIVDVPVPQIADRIVEVVTAFHRSESRTSRCTDR